jgi:hypothetical protein
MKKTLQDVEEHTQRVLIAKGHGEIATVAASHCAWLHGAGYNGMKYVVEALADTEKSATIEKDLMGLDLKGVSCVFIAQQVEALFAEHGRLFLRNVRHGLYLLPNSVIGNYGIGCPVDPGFALGGERSKNPYAEKIELATRDGVEVEEDVWHALGV